jgi:hypothetical protein
MHSKWKCAPVPTMPIAGVTATWKLGIMVRYARITFTFSGENCKFNCNVQCARFGATCKKFKEEKRWACDCPYGTAPSFDGSQCLSKFLWSCSQSLVSHH